jgi:hypothetical protein
MAYDAGTHGVVLFNGSATWTWSGTTWTKQAPATSPGGRAVSAMAYDPANGTVLLFGGYDGHFLSDTWIWG